jgi:hypothetical protein
MRKPDKSAPRKPPTPPAGNSRAITHGAYAASLIGPDATALVDELYARHEHLTERDLFAVRDYALAQARVWRIQAWLDRNSDFDSKGRLRPMVEQQRRWMERAERGRARLALDPASRLSLGVEEALTMKRLAHLFEAPVVEPGRTELETGSQEGPS